MPIRFDSYNAPYNPARNGRAFNRPSNLSSHFGLKDDHTVVNVNLPPTAKTEQGTHAAAIEVIDMAVGSSNPTAVKIEGSASAGATSTGRD